MSIYFYARESSSDVVRAAAGLKGFLFFRDELVEPFRRLYDYKNLKEIENPINAYMEASNLLAGNQDFSEESDHFRIISGSVVGHFLFLSNIATRICFSTLYGTNLYCSFIKYDRLRFWRKGAFRSIFFYARDCTYFNYIASPLLEVSFRKRYGLGFQDNFLYSEDWSGAISYLSIFDKTPDHQHLALAIDRAYFWSRFMKKSSLVDYMSPKYNNTILKINLIHSIFCIFLRCPSGIFLASKRVLSLISVMNPMKILRLVFGNKSVVSDGGRLPAIISPKGHIDPLTILESKKNPQKTPRSLEKHPRDIMENCSALAVWHVVRRAGEITSMIDLNIEILCIDKKLSDLWDVMYGSFFNDGMIRDFLIYLDCEILDSIHDKWTDKRDSEAVIAIALDKYSSIVFPFLQNLERQGRLEAFRQAIDSVYLQV